MNEEKPVKKMFWVKRKNIKKVEERVRKEKVVNKKYSGSQFINSLIESAK